MLLNGQKLVLLKLSVLENQYYYSIRALVSTQVSLQGNSASA